MSLQEGASEGPPPGGFAQPDAGDADPDVAADSSPDSNYYGLRNSTPNVSPAEVGQQLDVGAEWYEHLQCGFLKQSGGEGTEAWMHYVMACIIIVTSVLDEPAEAGGEEGEAEGFERGGEW